MKNETKTQRCKNKLEKYINNLAQKKVESATFDRTEKGIVQSIHNDKKKAVVLINGYERTCYMNPTYNIKVGQVVRVTCENNDKDRLYISAVSHEFYKPKVTTFGLRSINSDNDELNEVENICNGVEIIQTENGVVTIVFENIKASDKSIGILDEDARPHRDLTFSINGIIIKENGEIIITKDIDNDTITYVSKIK